LPGVKAAFIEAVHIHLHSSSLFSRLTILVTVKKNVAAILRKERTLERKEAWMRGDDDKDVQL